MTRPEDRLYIISNLDTRRGNTHHYFLEFLTAQKNSSLTKNNYQFGQKATVNSNISPVQNTTIQHVVSASWRNRLKLKKIMLLIKTSSKKYSIVWGDLIHKIMAGINTKDDIDTMLIQLEVKTNL